MMMEKTELIYTSTGPLYGQRQEGMDVFLGIPYAQSPIDQLRFHPPQAIFWQEPRACDRPGALAPQMPSRLARALGAQQDLEQSEDCLHLSIWAPKPSQEQKKPVVIWLHGGAWMTGGASLDWYDGENLARAGNIVVININYRLGPLGWLYVPGQTANVGLLDLAQAVQWVQDNVHLFGGDADNICLMGQSAGGSCVLGLLALGVQVPRVIVQSASLGRGFWEAAEMERLTQTLLQSAGVDTLEQARSLPAQRLLHAFTDTDVQALLLKEGAGRSFYCPVLDGNVLPYDLNEQIEKYTDRSDVLIGYTLHEMTAFKPYCSLENSVEESYQIFGEQSLYWAKKAAEQGKKAWAYRFDHGITDEFGACHCIELPYLFANFEAFKNAPMLAGETEASKKQVAHKMQRAWIQFIHGQSPGWMPFPAIQVFN